MSTCQVTGICGRTQSPSNPGCFRHLCAALFPNTANAVPDRPVISVALTHPGLASRLAGAARRLGYLVI